MELTPKVTIVTVVLDDKTHIEATILSVITQAYKNKEYIVVDGASKDGTIQVIQQYIDSIDVFISEPDKGLYDAMNKATSLATGDWIIYMNSGDRFCNEFVLYDIFGKNKYSIKDKSVIYSDTMAQYMCGTKRLKVRKLKWVWLRNIAVHQSIITRTHLAKRIKFNLRFQIAADYDFFYSVYRSGVKFLYIDDMCISICNAYEGFSKTANPFEVLWQASILSSAKARPYQVIVIVIVNLVTLIYAALKKLFSPKALN